MRRALKYSAVCWIVAAAGTVGFEISSHPGFELSSRHLWSQLGGELLVNSLLSILIFRLMLRSSHIQAEAEAVKRKAEARFHHLVDHASELVLTLDAAGQVVYASEAVSPLLGRTPLEVQGKPFLSLVADADRALAGQMLTKVLGSPRVTNRFALHLTTASEGSRFVDLLAQNLLDHADVSAVLLHVRDITAEQRLAQEKAKTEDRLRQALEAANLGSFEWNIRSGHIHADDFFMGLLGLAPGTATIDKDDLLARLPAEERQALLALMATARAKAGPLQFQFSLVNAEGRTRMLELHAQFRADPKTAELIRLFGVVRDVSERTDMLQRIGRYAAFPMHNPSPVLEFDAEGKVSLANDATRTVCVECQMTPEDFLPADFSALVAQVLAGQAVRINYELNRSGRAFSITLSAASGVPNFRCYVAEVTERANLEKRLIQANRALRMLVDCNQLIERVTTESELLETTCRLIVEEGGYRMAWVGFAEHDAEKTVRPMAHAGHEDGFTSLAHITWADSERGQGPTGKAIRTRLPQTCRDTANDPHYAPWREVALQRGYRSTGVFPLIHENDVLGTLNIYSAEVDHFDTEETKLLAELAGDLALGLGVIRAREGQQAAERAQAETAERLELALRAGNLGIYDLNVQTGEAVVNAEYALMLGYDPAKFHETNAAWLDRLHPEDQGPVGRVYADYIAGKLTEYRVEFRQRARTGEYKWILSVGRLVERDASGQPLRMIGTHTDITMSKQAQSQLQLQSAALAAAANVIVITDAKGTIESVNDAFTKITGYTSQEAIGNNPRVLKSGQHPPEFYQEMWRTISAGQVWHGEIHNKRKDGTPLEEDVTITPVKNAAGVISHFIAIKQDITEKKNLERQFLRAQRLESVGMLAGGIAHDLNNVLAPISMGLELLQQVPLPEKFQPVIDSMLTSTQRGAGIVKQVLTFARGTDGERATVQLRHLIKDIKRMAEETFPRNISLHSDVAADLWPLKADPSQLHQVLLNLSVNARDAMPDGGRLLYEARNLHLDEDAAKRHAGAKTGDYVLLRVTDTGTGMPPEVVDRIFEPFFTTKPQGQGTGLGLPTVLGIVRSHGGFLEVQSEPGKGTTFEVYLPAEKASSAGEHATRVKELPVGHGETILVVDDEPAVIAVTKGMLEAHGYRVLVAEDGAAAVAVYAQHAGQISVVVTDIMMPLMDGVALIRSLQRINPQVRIITVSGLSSQPGQPERHTELRAKGIRHHLDKPFTVESLLNALHEELRPV